MNSTVFIDWLSIAQKHFGGGVDLPVVGDGVHVKGESYEEVDFESEKFVVVRPGQDCRLSVPSKQCRGSFDTSLRIRCDGTTVNLSGNPGRFGRPDNVFNYGLPETISKASAEVQKLGLPAFTPGKQFVKAHLSERDYDLGLWEEWTGAFISELHATRNMSAGNEALAKEYMNYAASLRSSRIAKGIFGDETIIFGRLAQKKKRLHKAIVIYRKAEEMLAHAKGPEAKNLVKKTQEYEYARDTGLVRIECKWGWHFLRDNGLRFLGGINMAKIISIFERETAFLFSANPDRAVRLVSDMPVKLRLAALSWIRGDDLRQLMSRATYFRVVKALRDYGIDASERRSGLEGESQAEQDLQQMLDSLPHFCLHPLSVPEWYGLPELEEMKEAA
jgi:hypothetical protein